jgi:hypothetical protein
VLKPETNSNDPTDIDISQDDLRKFSQTGGFVSSQEKASMFDSNIMGSFSGMPNNRYHRNPGMNTFMEKNQPNYVLAEDH